MDDLHLILAVLGIIGTGFVSMFFWSIKRHIEILEKNTVAVAELVVEIKHLKEDFTIIKKKILV